MATPATPNAIGASSVPLPTPLSAHSQDALKYLKPEVHITEAAAGVVETDNDTRRPSHVGPPTPPDSNGDRSPRPTLSQASPPEEKATGEASTSGTSSSDDGRPAGPVGQETIAAQGEGQETGTGEMATAQLPEVVKDEDAESVTYTSPEDSDTEHEDEYVEADMSPRRREKRQRLKREREDWKPKYYYGEREAEEEAKKAGRRPGRRTKGMRGVPVFEPTCVPFAQALHHCRDEPLMYGERGGAQDGTIPRLLLVHPQD